ncbi:MAG TPA: TadE/TadG family type IV pilus assembly protein [Pseudolabrys sp.]|jgi:Flp pilus assembly protein TadG
MRDQSNSAETRVVQSRGRFWGDTQGAAAVEFGFLAPVLLLMLLATIETARAVSNDRHFTAAVATAGDLVAREENLGKTSTEAKTNLDGMMQSIKHLMQPYDATSLKLAVFSVRASPDNASDTKVIWSYSYNGMQAPPDCSAYTLPPNIVGKGGSVIVVDSTYVFKSLFGDFVPGISGSMTWTSKSYHSPRNSCVDYVEGDNCSKSC